MLEKRTGQTDEGVKDVDGTIADLSAAEPQSSGEAGSAGPHRRLAWYRDRLLLSTIPVVMVVDQVSKYLVKNSLQLYESWPEEGFFRITHGTNTGTVFGLLPNQTSFLIVASVFAIGFLYYFYRTQALPSKVLRLAIGLQLGGAFGNLLDRVRTGAVVDFIDVGPWPIFNLADSSIVVGIAVLVTVVVLGDDAGAQKNGTGDAVDTDR